METISKEKRTLDFLNDVHSTIELTSKFSMSKLIERHNLSKNTVLALREGGIVKNSGGKSRSANWEWTTTVKPNLKMAERVIYETSKVTARFNEKKAIKKEMKKNNDPVIVTFNEPKKETTKKEIVLFWGLFRYSQK